MTALDEVHAPHPEGTSMQLGASTAPGPVPDDVAGLVRLGAGRLGHRPAITQLLPSGRQEQSGASLAQWTAKGAHFLEVDLGLVPGDRILLVAPLGWTTAAVALAAWWAGLGLGLTPEDGGDVAVVHTSRADDVRTADMLWLGDGIDGAPTGTSSVGEAWVRAVQPFPDQPPPPRASADAEAVADGTRSTTQATMLRLATGAGHDTTLGLDGAGADPVLDLAWLCLRPLWCGRASVVTRGVPRSAADGDRVGRWR